jgi:hypothetical protein
LTIGKGENRHRKRNMQIINESEISYSFGVVLYGDLFFVTYVEAPYYRQYQSCRD